MAVAGVEAHRDRTFYRRLHEKWAQIESKIMDGLFVGHVGQRRAQFTLHAGL